MGGHTAVEAAHVAVDAEAPYPEEECFGDPTDLCRDACYPTDRVFECVARDSTGACVIECASRDPWGECEYGIECAEWEHEDDPATARCVRRVPMGCAPLPSPPR